MNLKEIYNIIYNNGKVHISENEYLRIQESEKFIEDFSRNKIIYGVNTGFGPMAQHVIDRKQKKNLQLNLIRSHCSGSGKILDKKFIRATLLARFNSLKKGYSGITVGTVELLRDFINYEVYPVIYEHGGVGASGDLVQLSHIALSLIGEGEVIYADEIRPTKEVIDELGLSPIEISHREGLALINGTSCMTGIGFINLFQAENLIKWNVSLSSIMYEVFEVFDDFFSLELNSVKNHPGQHKIAKQLRDQLCDSKRIKKRIVENYNFKNSSNILENKMQEYYSIRCTPQILGPILDTVENAKKVLLNEMDSVSDNPVIDADNQNIFHGGNFHGDYISMEMDKIKMAVTKLSILSERQLNYLFNDKINCKLPPFINQGVLGLNLGLQGIQFPATSTVSENMTLSSPAYLNNISTNADNQDVVSMGANAALITNKVIENTYEVLSIQFMAVINAVNYLDIHKDLSSSNKKIFKEATEVFALSGAKDEPHYKALRSIKKHLGKPERESVLA